MRNPFLGTSRISAYARAGLVGGLSLLATPALAVDCDQIMGMLNAGVPSSITVQTMKSSGKTYKPDEIQCLVEQGAPGDVVQTARELKADDVAAPAPTREPEPEPEDKDPLGGGTFPSMPDDLSDLPEEGDDGGTDPRLVRECIELYRAGKALTSSKCFFDMLEADEFPEQRSKLFYYMAKSLDDLGMYHGAQYYYMQAVRRGPRDPYFKYALPRLVAIAEYTGNETELMRIVHRIPANAFPRQAQNHLFYLMGRREYDKGNLSRSAKYFQQISSKSNLYLQSKYFEGVISYEREKLQSAVKAFKEVYDSDYPASDAREAREHARLRTLSLMNIARIYYELERFDNADAYYAMVDRQSEQWTQSLFERAWANFMLTRLNDTLGLLLTPRAPHFTSFEHLPDSDILRALTFFYLCEYQEANRILVQFERSFQPMRGELKDFLAQYNTPDGIKLADKAYEQYFEGGAANSMLSRQLLYKVLQNRDLASIVDHLDMMDEEAKVINDQKSVWRDSVGAHIKRVMEQDRQRYKQRAGVVLIQELDNQNRKLGDLLSQSQIIRFEIVDAQRIDLEAKASRDTPILGETDAATVDFAVSKEIIYWPFNGEFWADELGYYQYSESSACN
ncbi:MAG: hypothetical protein EA397_09330 [Deltaproteobacteria bacterium]|nr:MAG: hypothetical protein EA397_09330 [Deltaproteobacteria bacterium]